jgi:hypothetical protein
MYLVTDVNIIRVGEESIFLLTQRDDTVQLNRPTKPLVPKIYKLKGLTIYV